MNGKKLLQAMDGIDDAFVKEAMAERKPRRRWLPALAACLAAVLLIGLLLPQQLSGTGDLLIPQLQSVDLSRVSIALRWEGAVPEENGKTSVVSPQAYFHLNPVIVARAVEVLPETYEDLPTYGAEIIRRWRIFRLEILDPLDSGLTGDIWFALPEEYYQDLTAWDTLLLSMQLQGLDHTLQDPETATLKTFDRLYYDPIPYHGNTVAFTEGVFDESLWSQGLWRDPRWFPTSAYKDLTRTLNSLIVHRGSTLEEALAEIEVRRAESGYTPPDPTVPQAVLNAMDSLDDSFLGTGFRLRAEDEYKIPYLEYTRYLGGCMTNEYVLIHPQTGEILRSDSRFEAADLEKLPDLYAYMMDLDWDTFELVPDEDRGQLLYRAMYGWYEKTADGVLAFVKVVWYHESERAYVVYDDLYLQVTLQGADALTRQQMRDLLGESNANIPRYDDKEGPIHMLWKY